MSTDWDKYFFEICDAVAKNTKCLSCAVGAVIVKDKSIISTGYNGPPAGVPPCNTRYDNDKFLMKSMDEMGHGVEEGAMICPRRVLQFKSGEGLEFCIAGHAERNAIVQAAKNGICTKGATLYANRSLCKDCLIEVINAGIVEVVVREFAEDYDKMTGYLVSHSNIKIRKYTEEEE